MQRKGFRKLERILKGAANHRRIEILELLTQRPGRSVTELAEATSTDFRTLGEHLRKLTIAGLILKRCEGVVVRHTLTSRGKDILKFCRTLV